MEIKKPTKSRNLVHIGFEIGLLAKGIDGILEIVGAFLLMFLNPKRMNKLVVLLTQRELSEDPKDVISHFLITLSHNFSISTQHFGVFYLMSHGIIKCLLILLLWRRKLWAYPLSILSFVVFIFYQIYRYTFTGSVFLLLLSIFDIIMIVFTLSEYKRIKAQRLNSK